MELARVIKSHDEIQCMRASITVCEAAMHEMRARLAPGMTENALWSILHQVNIARGGEWIETRLLTSGPKTNPWFQESGFRIIEAGDPRLLRHGSDRTLRLLCRHLSHVPLRRRQSQRRAASALCARPRTP